MNNSEKTSRGCSWAAIIITLILFFPVGLFLLIKKATYDQKAALVTSKLLGVLSVLSFCTIGVGIVACMGKGFNGQDISLMIFLAFLGLILRSGAKRIKNNATNAPSTDNPPVTYAKPEKTKVVHCPYCGANSKIYGDTGECEYCGSPLQ